MINKLPQFDDREIHRKLDKMPDVEVLAYFLNANAIIQKRMNHKKGVSEK